MKMEKQRTPTPRREEALVGAVADVLNQNGFTIDNYDYGKAIILLSDFNLWGHRFITCLRYNQLAVLDKLKTK
jgi:hypothetical protein